MVIFLGRFFSVFQNNNKRKLLTTDNVFPGVASTIRAITPGAIPDMGVSGAMAASSIRDHSALCNREMLVYLMQLMSNKCYENL